jgi:hypothetical protein
MSNGWDNQAFSNISASTAAFRLTGGKYLVDAHATWGGGSVKLQRLAADATTYVSVGADFTADGSAAVSLAPGQYRFTVATATAVYVSVNATGQGD